MDVEFLPPRESRTATATRLDCPQRPTRWKSDPWHRGDSSRGARASCPAPENAGETPALRFARFVKSSLTHVLGLPLSRGFVQVGMRGNLLPKSAEPGRKGVDRSRAGKASVILSAAKDLGRSAIPHEILRCAQDDGYPVNGYDREYMLHHLPNIFVGGGCGSLCRGLVPAGAVCRPT